MSEELITVTGVDSVDRLLARLPKDALRELEKRLTEFSDGEIGRIRAAAEQVGGVAAMAAGSVVAVNGGIDAGGPGSLPTGRSTFGSVFFGAEFGGGARPETRQFKPYKPEGYWFFPTLESDEDDRLQTLIAQALDAAIGH